MKYQPKDIADRVKALRKAKGLTQHEMAELLAITQPNYNRIEKGEHNFTVPQLIKVSLFFKQSLDYLVMGKGSGLKRLTPNEVLERTEKLLKTKESHPEGKARFDKALKSIPKKRK